MKSDLPSQRWEGVVEPILGVCALAPARGVTTCVTFLSVLNETHTKGEHSHVFYQKSHKDTEIPTDDDFGLRFVPVRGAREVLEPGAARIVEGPVVEV